MRDSDLIVALGVVVGEVGVAEGAEEGEEAGVVAIETAEATMTTIMTIITMMIVNRVKESREAIPGIATTLATGNSERSGVGTVNVAIAMAKDGREGEGAGEEEEGAGDMAAIVTMIEKREGIAEGVMIEVVETMKMVERDRRGAVKAETGMIGMGKKFYKLIQPLLSADGFSELL